MPTSLFEYLAGLFKAEAARLRAEVDPGVRLMGGTTHRDLLAGSLERMAGKIEMTARMGGVPEGNEDAAA